MESDEGKRDLIQKLESDFINSGLNFWEDTTRDIWKT